MGWQYKRRENSYSMRPDSMQEHQVLDLLPRKKCIIKKKTLFELLNGLISLKHHDVITVVENRVKLSQQKWVFATGLSRAFKGKQFLEHRTN